MDDIGEIIRRRISLRLEHLDLTPITAAQRALLPRDTIRNLYRGDGSVPRADTLAEIAKALETTVAYLVGEEPYHSADAAAAATTSSRIRSIPVLMDLEWGRFVRQDQMPKGRNIEVNIHGYEDVGLFAGRMIDGHANLYYKVGTYVIFAPLSVGINIGEHLLVQRHKDDELEFTVRQLDVNRKRESVVIPMRYGSRYRDMKEVRFGSPGDPSDLDMRGVAVASLWVHERKLPGDQRAFYPAADLEGDVAAFSDPAATDPNERPLSTLAEDDIGWQLRGLKPMK